MCQECQIIIGHETEMDAAMCLLGDWNVPTKPERANQQKLVKIEEESTIGQLLKLWAQPKRPAGKTRNSSFLHIKILDLLSKCFIMNQKGLKRKLCFYF